MARKDDKDAVEVKGVKPLKKDTRDKMEIALANIEKALGNKGESVFHKGVVTDKASVISFGIQEVDDASNCGGIPRGKMVELYGMESGGKSYLSLKLIASAQRGNLKACLIDAEQSFDSVWAAQHGVDVNELYVVNKAMTAEKTLDYVIKLCEEGIFGLIVVDSTAALVPAKELGESVSDQNVALLARAMSNACRKIVHACGQTNTTCVFLNQVRDKIGVTWGDPTVTPGGKALKFYSHQRIQVTPIKKRTVEENGKEVVVSRISAVKFVKNKVARPWGEGMMEIVFDAAALNPVVRMCQAAKDCKIIAKRNDKFRIAKDYSVTGKVVETEMTTIIDLADYFVKEGMVEEITQSLIEYAETNDVKLDKCIKALLDKPETIVSPKANGLEIREQKVDNIAVDESEPKGEATEGDDDDNDAEETE